MNDKEILARLSALYMIKRASEPLDLPPVVPPVLNLNIGQSPAQRPAPQAPGIAGTGMNAKELAQPVYGPKGSGLAPYSSGIPKKPKNWRHPYNNTLRNDDAYKNWMARLHSYRELKSPGSTWGNPWTGPTSEELSGPNSLRAYAKLHPQAMHTANLKNYPDLFLEKKRPRSYER